MTARGWARVALLAGAFAFGAQAQTARHETTTYADDLDAWVLGQVASSKTFDPAANAWVETERTDYDGTTALPVRQYAFGALQQTLAHHADGTLASVSDARDSATFDTTVHYLDWYRGTPRRVEFPDGTQVRAGVNPDGTIAWTIDETGGKTCHDWDAMGRWAGTTFTSEAQPGACDASTWQPTVASFVQSTHAQMGLPAGHWRRTVQTGERREITYFDALWRPVLVDLHDTTDIGNTARRTVRRFDAQGRETFVSYPVHALHSVDDVTLGSRTTYDALGRATRVEQDSELGVLATRHSYLTGFITLTTDPRGHATRTGYLAWDTPSHDLPKVLLHPEGARTDFARDVFGKPTTLSRSGGTPNAWNGRYYVYDAQQRLCKRVELETGTTSMQYDAAGNLVREATGLLWSDTTSCAVDAAAFDARAVHHTWDARNRLTALAFPDGSGDQAWSYTPDGQPARIETRNGTTLAVNTYAYNARGLPAAETLAQPGWHDWTFATQYDALGNVAAHIYPKETITYQPNALGQPRQAVGAHTYATDVRFHTNGALRSFTYGNGIVHSVSQGARKLPERARDHHGGTLVLDESYDFDAAGNLAAISDARPDARGDRTMEYDGLDRLVATQSPVFGSARYTYDALDNLTHVAIGGAHARDHHYCYDAKWRLTNIKVASCTGESVVGLGYDAQGNLENRNGQAYRFDFGNRLREATGQEHYRYDGHGRRLLAWSPTAGNILSFYDRDGVLRYQEDARRGIHARHVHLAGRLIATRETTPATGASIVRFQHTDALGSPVAVTDGNRVVVERSEYEPYGLLLNRPVSNGPAYTGHVSDAATGMLYMQQRYYDAEIGRFLSIDPVVVDRKTGWNFCRYCYAANSPYKFRDPDGRAIDLVVDVGFIAYSGYKLATEPSWTNAAALGADVVGAAVPFATGLGAAVRAGSRAADVTRPAEKAIAAGSDAASANHAENVAKGIPESQLGPSGKPKIHVVDHGGKRGEAKEAARREVGRGGSTDNHMSPKVGKDHYHGTTQSGKTSRVHHEYDR